MLKNNNSLEETRLYIGSYEKQIIAGGATREVHYVSGGNGLCAILVKEGGIVTPYYVYTDHLGSLLTITNSAGTVIAEQNFDAWGRKRNPINWQYAGVPTTPAWLYRGYTSHEHLPYFTLINMNGRMYDPIQGRMLSPDNYVSTPFGTQGYNRYGYALNNPLTITDPDGEFILIVIGAAIGGVINLGIKAFQGKIGSFSDGLKAFGVGALAGGLGAATGGAALAATGLTGASVAGGALAGVTGSIVSSPILGVGNNVFFGDPYSAKTFGRDVLIGGIGGGIVGGAIGAFKGNNIWLGNPVAKGRNIWSFNNTPIKGKLFGTLHVGDLQFNGFIDDAGKYSNNFGGHTVGDIQYYGSGGNSGGNNIALGVREGLANFAKRVNGTTYKTWGKTDFESQFFETINNPANRIHFNLDGIDNPWRAISEGAKGFQSGGFTNWELYQIYSHSSILNRTIFYQAGNIVSNPFH